MSNLTAEKATTLLVYNAAKGPTRAALEKIFGKDTFEPDPTETIKTFEDACKVLGIKLADVLIKTMPKALNGEKKSFEALCKLMVIAKAINGDWVPDWSDDSQQKHYPWFQHDKESGFGFTGTNYDFDFTRIRLSAPGFIIKQRH